MQPQATTPLVGLLQRQVYAPGEEEGSPIMRDHSNVRINTAGNAPRIKRPKNLSTRAMLGSFILFWFFSEWCTILLLGKWDIIPEPSTRSLLSRSAKGCDPPPERNTGSTVNRQLVDNTPTTLTKRTKNLLIIASVPYDERHAAAIWSQLECLTIGIDKVVISAPMWSKPVVEAILSAAREALALDIEAAYFVNDRYDVGLWCDALKWEGYSASGDKGPYEHIFLINDSVFTVRNSTHLVSKIESGRFSLVGMTYSKNPGYWLESVYRAFTPTGIATYMNHSCVPATHESFCPDEPDAQVRKRCIVDYHEIAIAGLYPRKNITGIFSADPDDEKGEGVLTWVRNRKPWNRLVKFQGFPLAKVSPKHFIPELDYYLLRACTRTMNRTLVEGLDYESIRPMY